MGYARRPWKRSYRLLSAELQTRLYELAGNPIRVACVRVVPRVQIQQGHFTPLGIRYDGDNLRVPSAPVVPPVNNGPWARRNREGWTIVRRDLPKVQKTYVVETPDFGDWSRGSHLVVWTREVYQRDVVAPRNAGIRVVHEGSAPDENGEVLRFELDDIFDPTDEDFARQVLMGVNILQESVGCAGIFGASATAEEVLQYKLVDWVIFPPGTSDADYTRAFRRMPRLTENSRRLILERKAFLESLQPQKIVLGQAFGSNAYFGAVFREDLVVFENVACGNAVYILFENWEILSRLSRTELLRDYNNYIRIFHSGDWMGRLQTVLARLR